jgi:hypothetical protein
VLRHVPLDRGAEAAVGPLHFGYLHAGWDLKGDGAGRGVTLGHVDSAVAEVCVSGDVVEVRGVGLAVAAD